MNLTLSLPLIASWLITGAALIAHFIRRLPEHRAFGLYAVGLAAAAIHCLAYGNQTWGVLCIVLATACTATWLRRGGRDDVHRRTTGARVADPS